MVDDFIKSTDSKLDYTVDWSNWLPTGDEISDSSWSVPSGLTEVTDTNTTTTATIWISGGTANKSYTVTNTITTTAGRIVSKSFVIRVK